MSTPSQPHDATTFEQLIFQVRGIQAARVVTDQSGVIDEVHVVGLPGRTAKQVVRDIESILYVRGGVRLDHRKVSVVQLDEGSAQRQAPRVLLLSVRHEQGAAGAQVVVTLGLRGRKAVGVCATSEDEAEALLAVAHATLKAIDELLGAGAGLQIEQIALQRFGTLEVCLSHLSLSTESGLETLLGISMLREDVATTTARSVLDAINRPLLRLLASQP